ncbi:MAG: molybdate ABC transporter permease subunit [Patescibacteria group bacterium]|nr:molybdate ABC transporter permease subunit [Patescibacteria group bacterium]
MLTLNDGEWACLVLSVKVAVCASALVAAPGIACGWLLARKAFPGKGLADALVHSPLVLPPVATGYLLLVILGRNGPVGGWLWENLGVSLAFTWWAAVIASAVVALPLMVRSVRLAVQLVDPKLEEAAATLGAGPLRTFATVTLPLATPGILAGLALAFARSLGEFGATITFAGNLAGQSRTLPLAVYNSMQVPGQEWQAMRLVVLSILLAFAALLASEWMNRRSARIANA